MLIHTSSLGRTSCQVGNRLLRHRNAVLAAQNPAPTQMTMRLQLASKASRQPDVADATAFGIGGFTFPV